jgi:hypothetical protein
MCCSLHRFVQETAMNALSRIALTVAGVVIAAQAAAQATFYELQGFEGRAFTIHKNGNFTRHDFNRRASSVVVRNDRWELCEDTRPGGRCVVLRPGKYPSLAAIGLNKPVSSVRAVSGNARIDDHRYAPVPVASQIIFYQHQGFAGRSLATRQEISNFVRRGFNDQASSVVVTGNRWEVCEGTRFIGRCVVLRPGRYPSLAAMGLDDRISSVRAVSSNVRIHDHRYAPFPVAAHDSGHSGNERL